MSLIAYWASRERGRHWRRDPSARPRREGATASLAPNPVYKKVLSEYCIGFIRRSMG